MVQVNLPRRGANSPTVYIPQWLTSPLRLQEAADKWGFVAQSMGLQWKDRQANLWTFFTTLWFTLNWAYRDTRLLGLGYDNIHDTYGYRHSLVFNCCTCAGYSWPLIWLVDDGGMDAISVFKILFDLDLGTGAWSYFSKKRHYFTISYHSYSRWCRTDVGS